MNSDFQNFILDARIAVLGMTVQRKVAIQRIRDIADLLVQHLALIIAYPDSQEQKHWRKEAANFADQVNFNLKRSTVKIPEDLLLKLVYEEPIGTSNDRLATLQWMQRKMDGQKPDVLLFNKADFKSMIKSVLEDPKSIYI